ncbi:ankyrin repeat and SOCS box protein 5-like [Takifugu rubripes]|uniref:ankyrin repeat and SOCS box protein 5-like n=1 Tax=Takifugu rubripes TaxID=31033 RepID=UPI00029908D2|nr:ankyrin repeat and SOCS box protein 5-like [Takifugu rubripes]|eukprot:XP_003977386.1 PREDICTED: ankyrin repeat and SOCS box protein 5-like [Takifugu rubripes]
MPEVPSGAGAPKLPSRKRVAGPAEQHDYFPKKACWGILTSQGSWADRSPLHEAASQGRLLVLRTLLAQGYPANIVTIDHVTPLHEACLSGHIACVRALISSGANVNAATIDGLTPLYNCCRSGSLSCLEMLLQHGAHAHSVHTHYPSALHEACKRGSSMCVKSLLSHGADPSYESSHLGSPLYISCLHGQAACSEVLLHTGARVNAGRGSDSPLHAAVRQDCAEQVSLLLEFGADVNLRDDNNQRPLELAPPGGKTHQLLKSFQESPRSLCQLCRITIRDLIGPQKLKLLPMLPLPPLLTDYLNHK